MSVALTGMRLLFGVLGSVNALGGIVAGIWLLLAGAWWALGVGLIGLFVSHILVSVLLAPGLLLLGARAAALEQRGRISAARGYATAFSIYVAALTLAVCTGVFWLFLSRATPGTIVPLALWSYSVASGPWTYLAAKDQQGGGNEFSMIGTMFTQLGCLAAVAAVSLLGASLALIASAIGTFMVFNIVVQMWYLRYAESEGA